MEHTPVLLSQCIDGLNIRPDGIFLDGTLGRGGHAIEIAKRLDGGRLIAIDRDADAIGEAAGRLKDFKDKITFVRGNFGNISELLGDLGITAADGMLFDLGVSSPQLDNPERGFSYRYEDSALDMRMDTSDKLTAREIINTWPEERLRAILYEYGEERCGRQIARAIVRARTDKPIETAHDLNEIIIKALPPAARREKQHPSKRSFQAIRIAVNDELGSISRMLDAAPELLKKGGRICVISFHSLEDRLVKNAFAARVNGCICPKDLPVCACGFTPTLKLITKKPITPGEYESEQNPRARSAKLRIAERI